MSEAGNLSSRRTRRLVATAIVAALLAMLAVSVRGTGTASADTVNSDVEASCTSPIGPQAVVIPAEVTDTPDPVTAGDQMTISYRTDYPDTVEESFSIDRAESVWQMPPQVASIDDVTFTNLGTFTADPPVIDNVNMTVTATFHDGGTGRPPTPTINVEVTIDPGATGPIEWEVFVEQNSTASGVPFIGTVESTCTPSGTSVGQVLNSTTVIPAGTTTTTSTTTTTTTPPGPATCTQVASADGWVKNTIVGPGGLFNWSNGSGSEMYTTEDGFGHFRSSLKFPGVGGACAEGGSLPAGVTVTDAAVSLTKTESCFCLDWAHRLYRITQSWSEGNLHPSGGPSVAGSASATFSTPGSGQTAVVQSAQIIDDVQGFVDDPGTNQGWSLRQRDTIIDTGNAFSPAGWATRENGTAADRPTLSITYQP